MVSGVLSIIRWAAATSVHGNGMDPGMDDILAVAGEIGMEIQKAKRMAEEIRECIHEKLGK